MAEAQLSEELRKEVAAQRLEMESLKLSLKEAEARFDKELADQATVTATKLSELKSEYTSLNQDLIAKHEAATLASQKAASDLQKQIAIQEAALAASQQEYDAKLAQVSDEQKALLEAERQARVAELEKLGNDMNALKSWQEEARKI